MKLAHNLEFQKGRKYTIAIDFDGTIVEHQFPAIGRELNNATTVIKMLQQAGHKVILWTCRHGKTLDDAVRWLAIREITPDAVNKNLPWVFGMDSPKVVADVYIDDRNFGSDISWMHIAGMFGLI